MQRNQQQQITKQQQQYSSQQEYVQQQQQFSSQQRIEQSFTSTRQVTQQVQQRVQQQGGYVQQISQTPTNGAPAAIQYVQQPATPTSVSATPTLNYAPPIFEQIFKNARFAQGGNATFEGRLKGTPMPEVSWTRKGAPLFDSQKFRMTYNQTTGDVTLTINQIGPGDEGEYTCRARNAVGEAICSVFIQPEGFPAPQFQQSKINVQQQQQRVYQQQTTKQTNGYSLTSHEEEFKVDTFEYRLLREVTFREQITRRYAGEVDTQLSTLVDRALGPASPPLIQVKPRNSKLIEGSDATFSMKVAGNPKVRLSWFHNGNRIIPSETKHEISYSNNQATLRIKNSAASDSGHYTLLAENTQGCVVSSAVLAIEPAQEQRAFTPAADNYAETTEQAKALSPTFVKVFQDRETQEGKMTRFDCRVTGRPYPEVTWFINQVQVNDDATHKILVNESGNHSLMITNVSRFDGGVVTCIARNKSGEVSTQASLIVLEREQVVAPKFVERFTTVNIREGEPVRLCARAVGTPVPRITWQKDGAQLIPNDNLYIGVDGGATALDIPQAMASDAGWYQCTAQNVAGSTATRARLFVETTKPQYTEQRKINFPKPTRVIEPEPQLEPEIIYLRHVERAKPHASAVEEDRVYSPPQFIVPLRDVNQIEGGKVHFEGRIEPVGDPTMRVEFLLNGKLIVASSRANCTFQFGFVALDLISVIVEDSGEYVCRVTSASGTAESRAILRVTQKPAIEKSTQHPSSLEYIQNLEDYSKYQRSESIEETTTHMPHFIRPLQDLGDIEEGKNAHFEAQLTPVSDPTMRVEWYKDGRAITASSRITAIFNFGYVSLNIMHLRAEDSGSYTVRAVNRIGEALSTSNIRIICKETVTGDLGISEQQRHIQKCEQLEQYHQYQNMRLVEEQPESTVRPEFKNPISDQLNIREGGFAHFEARLEPVGDSTLRVEWMKDGKVVEASSRITSFFNFGYVALTIKQVTVHDVGTYTCRAYNAMGEAQTAAKMTVITKQDVIVESQHQLGLERIQQLEDSTRYTRTTVTHEKQKEQEEILLNIQPRFLGPMKGTTKIIEGQRAHFEVRVEPQSDLSMQIEWYHNGQPIMPANRIQMYHDFGYVALDILGVRGEDAGTYTVVARNNLGEAQTCATMLVETRSSIDTSTLHRGTYEKTQRMEDSKFVEPQYNIEEICRSKPYFTATLSDPQPVQEGRNIHLECKLEPVNDPTMKVEWFQNGRPITVGSRFRTYYDFGFVALDIIHASTMDVGEYTVRATNQLGSAHTSACVRVIGQRDVVTETQNEMSLEHIQFLEDGSRYRRETSEDVSIAQAPTFTRPLHNIETIEGTNVHLECRLQPVSDPYMRVDWFVNGVPVKTGHRFRPAHDFDYVALDLLGVYATDSGVYTCQARNQLGEAVTSCSVKIIAKKDLIMDSQYPAGLEKIQYLEDTSRYQRNEYVDEIVNIKPRFLTKPKSLENMKEGQHAHFECKLEPVTDPNLKVEWFKNGRPIAIGHRFRPIHDFGYVALDVTDLIAEDTATYTCRAVNLVGHDEINCNLICKGSAQILTTTQNEVGLEQIQFLEDKSRYQRHEEIDEVSKQAPIFTTSLKNIEIREGQRAHFECRLIPVSDPHLKVEWYHNNVALKSGSRFTETNNFGFVALDIMACMPEDSGTYTCRAINQLGEAITSAVAVVHSRKAIVMESQHEAALQTLRILEDTSRYQRDAVQDETITQAPVFTLPVRDVKTKEGHAVHYEARLIPVGDPKLTVQWFRNGVPIEASNRISTMHDFGYVALNMKYANPEDTGTYTCRAINELGQAVTSAKLDVQSKAALDLQTQNEAALEKIHMLEDSTRYQRREDEDVIVTQPPHFTVKLMGPSNLKEGQSAHYECRIEPYPDPNLKVEWLHNGKPLQTGHRFRTSYDFGFAALDILTVYPADSGEYTCRVTNRLGQAQSAVKLNVASRSSIIHETQNEGAMEKIQYLEDASRFQRRAEEEQFTAEKPQFGRPLRNANVNEGVPIHLEATLVPVNDPTMKVEWFVNGRPIPAGSRFRTTYDFGFVALDIMDSHSEDTGTYMCKAKNAVGEAITTCAVKVTANKILYLETLDEDRYKKIRELESYQQPKTVEAETPGQKPIFLTPLNSLENLKEGDYAHLECRVEPINDPDLRIDWFVNGKPIRAGHRFRTTHDFGYVALDILYAYGEDTGTYMCRATNKLGEAVSTCNIKVINRRSIILDSQHPDGLEKIQKLEAQSRPSKLEVEDQPVSPPRFVTEMRGTNEAAEGQTAHFEGQIEPIHDPNLRIEFFHDGKPLQSASRFHTTFDFGYVSLDITHVVPEDAGEYTVKAFNALGQCKSSVNFKVVPKGSIIYDTQIPGGLEKIKALESAQPWQRPEVAEPATKQRPVFTQPLQNIDYLPEGQNAHFEARLIPVGDPNLKVEWFRNEKPIEDSSRIRTQHDFGFVSMDIAHIRDDDQGVYMCRATNPLGEAVTTASMKVGTKASILLDTQHPEGMRKIMKLEQPLAARPEEPDRDFEKPIFTQLLTGPSEIWEGQNAHFEARVVPVGDPSLRFEWYVNGKELKLGSRIKTTTDFGFVTLDIVGSVPEDAGVYMCKAINKAGEAVSSISMKVRSKSSIVGESLLPESWEKIQLKEASMQQRPELFPDSTPQQAPVFIQHLQSHDKLVEGQHIYLEATVEPKADPNLRIEWFKNGVQLTTGARIKSTFDFGLVGMSINSLRDDDSAIYTCKATNLFGEAVTTCTLKVEDKHWLLGESLHPQSLPRIIDLEAPRGGKADSGEPVYESPVFITHLNNVECKENDNPHFECNVEPSKDPTMKIEWFVNGKPLPAGARYKTTYDFGFCSLDIIGAYAEDSGVYTCKATNNKGTASTSGTLKCTGTATMFLDTQHPQGKAGLEAVEGKERDIADKYKRQTSVPDKDYGPPEWIVSVEPEKRLGEAQPLHLEGQVEPKQDPNLKIEWYFNGKQLQHGSRFKFTNDFGFVTLDLTEAYERDQGVYTCKAVNKKGEAFTTSTVYCTSKEGLIERTQHPKGKEGLEAIQDLEDSLRRSASGPISDEDGQAPRFTSEFVPITNIVEGEIAHFEATLVPTGDQSMIIEWFHNDKQIDASHRIRTVYAFGMVILEILGTKIPDSGTYTCRATNKYGKTEQSVTLGCVDKSAGQPPKFTTQIQKLEGLKDGQSAHFECTLEPVGDPDMKVEWFHNGVPMRHSTRIKPVSDFGYVLLDIAYVQSHDSGEYICKASNKYGEDYTRATIQCYGKGGVFYDTLQPDSLARIRELESLGQQPGQQPSSPTGEAPKFTQQIVSLEKLVEGQSAHFEARLTPTNDPDLHVEWYWNGKKLPHGHRFRTFHDFGIVILDILYCYEENSGEYECRAVNKYGSDSTKATLKCLSKANLILDSQLPRGMEGGLEKIQTLEDSLLRDRDDRSIERGGKAPVFTVPLSNIDSLREGESAHFEARLTPTDDPKLKVEWFWNGKPLKTGSRFRTFCDFGFVILEISPVYPEDSGEYSCRATNDYGEAVTISTMKVQGKRSIIYDSQLPKGMEGTIDKIAELEGLGAGPGQISPDDDSGKPPEFITTPTDLVINENQLAHFECRLTPVNDPSMRVEWYHNGKALWAGSRIKTINDFGFVILEIAGCYQRDGGMYTCKATNKHGEASVSCQLQCRGRQGIIMEPQLPSSFRTGTEAIQKLEENLHKREEIPIDDETPNPPRFLIEIKDNVDIAESGPLHFDCRVEPVNDPSMRIDWYHNGRPFATGSRVHMLNDFGFIALDMDYVYSRDSGVYECRATNKWGSASTIAKIIVKSKTNIIYDSQLPEGMTGEKLKELERGPVSQAPKDDAVFGPPKFVTHIQSLTVDESDAIRFEARVEPKEDPRLRIEWYRNGKPLPSGHRFRTLYDMGFISLDVLYIYAEDSGEYTCRAVNDYGEDITKAFVTCKKLPSIILQNQIPKGMQKSETVMQMEATIKKYTSEIFLTEDDLFDPDRKQPPRFVTQILSQEKLVEMQSTKFECQLAPVGDPNMRVEWFFNGKPLSFKNRFTPIYDFGYVAMNFGWVYPEDSGEYLCRATNLYGMDETRAFIKTSGKPGIIYDSQLPKGMKSLKQIREIEANLNKVPEEKVEPEKAKMKPTFVLSPDPVTIEEGEWARFCCRVTGHPRPRVMWLINGHTVVNGQRYKLSYDGMYHFDIPKTRQYDTGKIEVIARNSAGEAITSTDLQVISRKDDYRGVLKNSPRPWYDYDLVAYQKERYVTDLEKTFEERNQTIQERGGVDLNAVHLKPKEVKSEQPDWQKTVKSKKTKEYYDKLSELESEQLVKEQRIRESTHQYALPGDSAGKKSIAKGMAHLYESQLEKTEEVNGETTEVTRIQRNIPDPSETTVHGKEVHVSKQKQVQKETIGDTEITRKITATETTEVEHKGTTQERVVEGPVKPSKPPVFTKKIQPCRIFENEQAKFEVEFDGEPTPKVKWFRENFEIHNSKDFQIHTFGTKSVLIMRQALLEDSAVFAVIAENRGGTAKCSANLVVEERRRTGRGGLIPPSFVSTIQDVSVTAGQLARFDARVTGTKPIDVYWLKDGKRISPNIKYKMLEEDNVNTLLIIEAYQDDAGKYECVAINGSGEARCDATCSVDAPASPKIEKPTTPGAEKKPIVLEPLKEQKVVEGSAVVFKTKATGKPVPTAQWYKGDKIIKPSKYFQMTKEREYYTLKISEAFPEDEGEYKCVLKNSAGETPTKAKLSVLAPEVQDALPKLTPLKDVVVTEGQPAKFKTTHTSKSKVTVQWFREGLLIPESPDFQFLTEGSSVSLVITNTYEEDSGVFTCRITNNVGQVETSAKLIVKKHKTIVKRVSVDKITHTDKKSTDIIDSTTLHTTEHDESTTETTFKKTSGGQYDSDVLVIGDETLPWRQVKKGKPWTEEVVQLKKTPRQTKQAEKETLETVELKPSKIHKSDVQKTELERVDLKHRRREITDTTEEEIEETEETTRRTRKELYQTEEDTNLLEIRRREEIEEQERLKQKYQTLDDSNILKVDKKEDVDEQEKLVPVMWKRGEKKKEKPTEETKQPYQVTEDTNLLDVQKKEETEKKEELVPVMWKRGEKKKEQPKEETKQPYQVIEDTNLLDVQKKEETDKKEELVPVMWKRGEKKKEQPKEVEPYKTEEDTAILEPKQEEVEETEQPTPVMWKRGPKKEQAKPVEEEKPQEAVPWNKQVQLKKTERVTKQVEKEKLENVDLKPTKIQKADIEKVELEKVDLKYIKPDIKDVTSEVGEIIDYQVPKTDDTSKAQYHIEEDSSLLGVAQKEEIEKQEEPLKPVSWRRGKKETADGDLVEKQPQPVAEIEESKPEEQPIPTPWRRGKKEIADKELVEPKPVAEVEETKTEEQPAPAPWRRGKKEKATEEEVPDDKKWPTGKRHPLPEEPKEEIKLKPIPRKIPQKEEQKPEEVTLKPIPKKPIEEKPHEPEDIEFIPAPVKEVEQPKEEEVQPTPWRRGKKEKPKEEEPEEKKWPTGKRHPLPEEPKEEVTLKPIPKKPVEEKPSEPEEIKIKPAPVKEVEQPEDEEVQTTPWRRGKKEKADKEQVQQEPMPVPEVEETKTEEQPTPTPWRRGKKATEEEVPDEKKWPTGKRHPLPEEPKEEIKLKPIPRKVPEEEKKPEEITLKPIPKKPVEEKPSEPEEIKFKPAPVKDVELPEEEEVQTTPWRRGKKEKADKEQVQQVPMPVPEVEETKTEEQPTPTPWRRGKKATEEEVPDEKKWPTGKRHPLPEEPKEEIKLKPIPRKIPEEEKKPEEITLKPIPKKPVEEKPSEPEEIKFKPAPVKDVELPEEEEVQTTPWRRGKKEKADKEQVQQVPMPVPEVEETKTEEQPTPTPWRRGKKATEEEVPDEKKWPTGKRHPLPEEPKEEIKLKPIPRKIPEEEKKPEEITLKPIPKKPVEEKPSEPEEIKFKPAPVKDVELPEEEEVQTTPWRRGKKEKADKEQVQQVPMPVPEVEETKTEEQPTPTPWRRGKKATEEEVPDEKKWPTGKRHPLPEEPKEEIKLKPIPRKTPKEEVKPEEITLKPIPKKPEEEKSEEIEEPEEDIEAEELPEDEFEEPVKEKEKKKKKKKKPKHEEPKEEEEEIVPQIPDIVEPKPEAQKPKKEKHVAFREELSTIEITSDSNDETLDAYEDNLTVEQISLKPSIKKPSRTREPEKQEEYEETEEFKKETQVTTSSQAVHRLKKELRFDDSRPIPDLEIISQKRILEGIHREADEKLIEERQIRESKMQISSKSLLEKSQIKTTVANIKPPKFVQKLQPVISQPEQPVVLKGEVDGNPFPDIKWFFNETEISRSERYEMTAEKHNVSLIIKHVQPKDIGIYTCQAINPGGVATSRTNVIVQEPEETGIAPSFITPLKITVPEDKDKAIVTCQVHGLPTPIVKWYKEDTEIVPNDDVQTIYDEETGYVSLEVYNPETNVPVNYTIKAENDFGKAIGKANVFIQSIIIEKKAEVRAPKILTPLQAQVVKNSSTLVFTCDYDGLPVPKIKWIKNGKEIIKDENTVIETHEYTSRLEIRNVNRKNGGKYEIIVTNKAGEAKSSGSVMVSETESEVKAPQFIEPLVPKTVAESECVILEATVSSYPTASFQWFYNNTPLVSSNETRIATTENKSILIVETFDKRHIGSYTCRAENVAGSVTSTATVNIIEPFETEEVMEFISPRFTEKAESVRIMDGDKLVITAKVQGSPRPKVEWQHDGDVVNVSNDIFTQQDNSGLCTLTIKEVFPEDAGEYVCIAKNTIGEAVTRCFVTVDAYEYIQDSEITAPTLQSGSEEDLLEKFEESVTPFAPTIVKELPKVTVSYDKEMIKFEVKVVGHPKPQVKWLKAGEEIMPSDEFQIENLDDGTSILIINDVYPDDTGEIKFEAFNSVGIAETITQFIVEEIVGTKDYRKPEWVSQMEEMQEALQAAYALPGFVNELKNIRALEGDRVKFRCTFKGNPPPAIIWYHNNKALINGEKFRILTNDEKSTLIIRCVERDDYGFYICKAMNDAGDVTTRGKLIEAFSALDDDDSRKKSEKKSKKMRRIAKSTDGKMTSSVNVEATVRSSKKASKSSKIIGDNNVDASATFKRKIVKVPERISRNVEASSELTITKTEEIYVQETEETFISEVEHKTCHTTITINDLKDINDLKNSKEVNEILSKISGKNFGAEEESVKELATVSYMLQSGLSTNDIQKLFQANQFPNLQKTGSQSALVQLLEREGHETIVSEIMSEKSEHEIDESFVASVGFRAFLKMIEEKRAKADELIMSIKPEDFTSWKNQASEV